MSHSIGRHLKRLAALGFFAFCFFAKVSIAETNVSLGLSYSKGYNPYFGGAGYYNSGMGMFGPVGNVCTGYLNAPTMPILPPITNGCNYCSVNNGWNNGVMWQNPGFNSGGPSMPALPPLPPPAPLLPPHLAMPNMGWGPGFNSYPGPIVSGGPCNPCMNRPPVGPVPGGPAIYSNYNGLGYGPGGMGMYRNEWEKSDTADIIWGTAFGLGMQTSNVYPLAVPRFGPTTINPTWFNMGPRDSDLTPRPHTDP